PTGTSISWIRLRPILIPAITAGYSRSKTETVFSPLGKRLIAGRLTKESWEKQAQELVEAGSGSWTSVRAGFGFGLLKLGKPRHARPDGSHVVAECPQ